jgi:hypothetical protein
MILPEKDRGHGMALTAKFFGEASQSYLTTKAVNEAIRRYRGMGRGYPVYGVTLTGSRVRLMRVKIRQGCPMGHTTDGVWVVLQSVNL